METALSAGKISVPRSRNVLEQRRLMDRLAKHAEDRLILILGQAAQGKLTLAASYMSACRGHSAWIT